MKVVNEVPGHVLLHIFDSSCREVSEKVFAGAKDRKPKLREQPSQLRWENQFNLNFAPAAAHEFHDGTLPQEGVKSSYFNSTKISEHLREYAANQGMSESELLKKCMEGKSREFMEKSAKVYAKA